MDRGGGKMTPRIAPLALAGLLALGALNAWLLAVVTAEHGPEQATAAAGGTEWTPGPLASELQPHSPKSISAYSQTLAAPVFFKSRQPYVPPPPPPPPSPKPIAAPPPAPVDPGLVLGGIMITDGVKKAYLFNKADAKGVWLSEGDTIAGWKVETIDSMSAKLQQAGRAIELPLYPKR
jgi:hypothetical protein